MNNHKCPQIAHSYAALILVEILFDRGLINKETMNAVRVKLENQTVRVPQAA